MLVLGAVVRVRRTFRSPGVPAIMLGRQEMVIMEQPGKGALSKHRWGPEAREGWGGEGRVLRVSCTHCG